MVVGTMTGTSMDGVDAVAVEIKGVGTGMQVSFHAIASTPLGSTQTILQDIVKQSSPDFNIDFSWYKKFDIQTTNGI